MENTMSSTTFRTLDETSRGVMPATAVQATTWITPVVGDYLATPRTPVSGGLIADCSVIRSRGDAVEGHVGPVVVDAVATFPGPDAWRPPIC